jgi:MoxR-like ATPase
MSTTNITPAIIRDKMNRFWDEVHKVLKGCDGTTKVVNRIMLGGGHANLVGVPGTGKSLMAEAMAAGLGGRASIFSFTADMMPTDIVGSEIYDAETGKMITMTGFIDPDTHFVLGDEYNRAPEKTMSAFMEPLQTGRVRQGRVVKQMASPFFFIGVKNPVEQGGTYPTPEAMLDRFMGTTVIGYTTFDQMVKLAQDANLGRFNPIEAAKLQKALEPDELGDFIEFVRTQVELPDQVAAYIARIVSATRPPEDEAANDDPWKGELYTQYMPNEVKIGTRVCKVKEEGVILVGASNRGLLALAGLSKAHAVMNGRTVVTDHDVKSVAVEGLAHRLTPNKQRTHKYPQHLMRVLVKQLLENVPTIEK